MLEAYPGQSFYATLARAKSPLYIGILSQSGAVHPRRMCPPSFRTSMKPKEDPLPTRKLVLPLSLFLAMPMALSAQQKPTVAWIGRFAPEQLENGKQLRGSLRLRHQGGALRPVVEQVGTVLLRRLDKRGRIDRRLQALPRSHTRRGVIDLLLQITG